MTGLWPDWTGETVAVVAGGSSAAAIAPYLRGRCRCIVVNLAYRLLPGADVLYGADSGFWMHYREACRFNGLKVAPRCQNCGRYFPSIIDVDIPYDSRGRRRERMLRKPVGSIGNGGGNGGFQAVNLAVQFGAARVLLAGIDFCGPHWHEDHPAFLRNPSEAQFQRWRAIFDAEAPALASWGVDVVNLSPVSALKAYRHEAADRIFAGEGRPALPADGV